MSKLLDEAIDLVKSGDKSYKTWLKLIKLGKEATGEEQKNIGRMQEAFIVAGGKISNFDEE